MPRPPKTLVQKSLANNEIVVPSSQSDLAALFNQGLAMHQQGQLAQAKQIYTEVLAKNPNYYDALHLAGVIDLQSNNPMLALELIDRAIEIKPDYAEAWSNRGNALSDLKRYEEALANCDKAIEIKPDFIQAWICRGNALHNLKR